ncbi:MAG: hypothetical protein LPK38_06665 [Actinomycetes bacterium]|nr:hypothetical protein [Actinomycetes bacterium]MDX5400094.1 hypothetical protein [Actinomycetes bacterium]MDX5450723.1 hypothetical protein [Actinomycetes bacterium]
MSILDRTAAEYQSCMDRSASAQESARQELERMAPGHRRPLAHILIAVVALHGAVAALGAIVAKLVLRR